ncbi:MAG: hypothetical protein JXC32_22145 [Anaerolineae bacterium]|nr:hypothetical protein [Anaerolineae bacterium]
MKRFLLCLVVFVCASGYARTPEPVVSLREKTLSSAAYRALAQQWTEYMERNGESAEGHTNVGQAYRYAGEAQEVYLAHYARAVQLDSTYARALDLYACQLWIRGEEGDMAKAREMLERARTVDPTYGDVLYSLYGLHSCTGSIDRARETAREIYERRLIHVPIWDFGYNILAGLPQGAVVVTNGDNDTYPLVSLQAGRGFRDDVIVLNQSLLRCPSYAKAMREAHADWFPDIENDVDKGKISGALAVIRELVKTKKRPIYVSLTVPLDRLGTERSLTIEGLCARVDALGGNVEAIDHRKTLTLFRDTYRLDSATDWTYPWDLRPAEQKTLINYLHVLLRAAEDAKKAGDRDSAARLADIGLGIARFHNEALVIQRLEELAGR